MVKQQEIGKGTLTDTILYMHGDYAKSVNPETLAEKKNKDASRASEDIARLNGCRFINISEPSKAMVIDSSLLKTLLGGDKILARNLYKGSFEFYPNFKLFINCNYLPIINDNTVFDSDRINVITFDKHFEKHERDTTLKAKLKEKDEISGIFNWCLNGLKKLRNEGLTTPTEIRIATAEYQKNNDKFLLFFSEKLIKSDKNTTFADIYRSYKEWCEKYDIAFQSKSQIKEKLKNKGIFINKGTVNGKTMSNVIIGYELK